MIRLLRRLLRGDDVDFDKNRPWGRCEAVLGHHFGMPISCGKRTNIREAHYWTCSKHPVTKARRFIPKGV